MRKKTEEIRLTTLLPGLVIICLSSLPVGAQYGGGTGEPGDPYLIYTAEQMNRIGAKTNDLDKHFKLMADIDLSIYVGMQFRTIGSRSSTAFRGVFDGNRKRIQNLTYTSTNRDYVGLFGYLSGSEAEIRNLELVNPNIDAGTKSYVGSLVGYNEGTITNCYATSVSVSGGNRIGGLIGYTRDGTITNCRVKGGSVSGDEEVGGLAGSNGSSITSCYASCDISGEDRVGGLVGYNSDGTIDSCYARGIVEGDQNVGGLVGNNIKIIKNCYATGGTTGNDRVGGLVGRNTWPAKITNCYSVGAVTGTTDVGGLVGFNDEAVIKTSFWDTQTSGRSDMCGQDRLGIGCDNAGGKTTAGMQRKSTFLDAGWDFDGESENGADDIWIICDGLDYPEFARQFVTGDFDGDNRVDLADFAFFAERWLSADRRFFWCRGADLTGDGEVGVDDLREFADNWLAEGVPNLTGTVYLTVDDFESYNDLDPCDPESNRIFNTWLDGYENPSVNGAVVGYLNPPFTEHEIVHGGTQSMPYLYNTFFKFSKAERLLNPSQDWTKEGEGVLSLWFHGNASNTPAPMSVVLNGGSAVYHDNANAVRIDTWTEWAIDLQAFTGVDLTHIDSIAICFGYQNNLQAGGTGRVFFDDIRLCGPG